VVLQFGSLHLHIRAAVEFALASPRADDPGYCEAVVGRLVRAGRYADALKAMLAVKRKGINLPDALQAPVRSWAASQGVEWPLELGPASGVAVP
jgi:hypothetical protein